MKKNLPVLIQKNDVLLPFFELKIEVTEECEKNVIYDSENFYNNKVLVVIENEYLPKLGVIARIKDKIELPNGNIRFKLQGIVRARIYEYLNLKDSKEAIIEELDEETIDPNESSILIKKIRKELDKLLEEIPYISNSVIDSIDNENNISKVVDIVCSSLMLDSSRLIKYLYEISSINRVEMLLEDMLKEYDSYNVEKELDEKVLENMNNSERELILREKIKTMQEELGDFDSKETEINKLKEKANTLILNEEVLEVVNKEIDKYDKLSIVSPESGMVRNYIDWILRLPWNKVTVDNDNLLSIKNYLDACHYGSDDVKTRILEYLAVKKMTNSLKGPIICLVGPPGVGKTTLAYDIARAMNRNFVKISLGGVHDESEIRGHRKSYLGSYPGRIITSLVKAKSSNPVFLLDEVDKMTNDVKGDPSSALLEVLDPEQNKFFSDNYLEIEYDLSNVMFILTANNIDNIPPALKDRLEIIRMDGYTLYDKLNISKKYLIPHICKRVSFDRENISISDNAIISIIKHYTYEVGVRELDRVLCKIIRKSLTNKLVKETSIDKIKIEEKDIKKLLGNFLYEEKTPKNLDVGCVNALGVDNVSGRLIEIETSYYKGTGKIKETGTLGDIMKDSIDIAFSYIKANNKYFNIDYKELEENDFHIHVLESGIKKDGSSAGVAITTSIISSITKQQIPNNISMTGEITLHGKVLKIGGLKQKLIAAKTNSINTIFIPKDNYSELEEIEENIKENLNIILVENYKEIYNYLKEHNNG